jgi:hypothetical protein
VFAGFNALNASEEKNKFNTFWLLIKLKYIGMLTKLS